MLILTKRIGESINIKDGTQVAALGINGNQVWWAIFKSQEITTRSKVVPFKSNREPTPQKGVLLAWADRREREMIAQHIKRLGVQVLATDDAEEVLNLLQAQTYLIAILDNDLEDCNAIEIGKMLRMIWLMAGTEQKCRIFIAGSVTISESDQRDAGAQMCFRKPLEQSELNELVKIIGL